MDHLAWMTTFMAMVEKGGFISAARHLSFAPATVT
jgi:DNA-binding transcriptional LysR family regulator